jgi:Xaa-Pro aminopeptidase
VSGFFHRSFAWFGDRTRFAGIKNYYDFLPKKNELKENQVVILDVAPIYRSYSCDIGYSFCFGEDAEYNKAQNFLQSLRKNIPVWFHELKSGSLLCKKVHEEIIGANYDNIHHLYPFSVLGHRLHRLPETAKGLGLLNFGWQSYWGFLSRGLFGQLLNQFHEGSILGLWAIEPHIGAKHFGIKFEEILVVTKDGCYWLEDGNVHA